MAIGIQAWELLRGGDRPDQRSKEAAGDTAITTTMTPVVISSSKTAVAGDGTTVYGVQMPTSVSGDLVTVLRGGVFRAQAASGVNFAVGDVVYLAASYELDAGASGNLSCGVVIGPDPYTAGLVTFELRIAGQTTHA